VIDDKNYVMTNKGHFFSPPLLPCIDERAKKFALGILSLWGKALSTINEKIAKSDIDLWFP